MSKRANFFTALISENYIYQSHGARNEMLFGSVLIFLKDIIFHAICDILFQLLGE